MNNKSYTLTFRIISTKGYWTESATRFQVTVRMFHTLICDSLTCQLNLICMRNWLHKTNYSIGCWNLKWVYTNIVHQIPSLSLEHWVPVKHLLLRKSLAPQCDQVFCSPRTLFYFYFPGFPDTSSWCNSLRIQIHNYLFRIHKFMENSTIIPIFCFDIHRLKTNCIAIRII